MSRDMIHEMWLFRRMKISLKIEHVHSQATWARRRETMRRVGAWNFKRKPAATRRDATRCTELGNRFLSNQIALQDKSEESIHLHLRMQNHETDASAAPIYLQLL